MSYVKQLALGIIAAELILAAVLVASVFAPLPGKVQFKIVLSGSMEPAVPVGSVVFIAPSATYAVGDIITFGEDTKKRVPVTHRIVSVEREAGSVRYQTKGDANEQADNLPIKHAEVLGRVVLTVPRLGYVFEFARSRTGFIWTIVVPASFIVLDELITLYGAFRDRRRARRAGTLPTEKAPRSVSTKPDRTSNDHRQDRTAHRQVLFSERAGIDGCRVVLRPQYTS